MQSSPSSSDQHKAMAMGNEDTVPHPANAGSPPLHRPRVAGLSRRSALPRRPLAINVTLRLTDAEGLPTGFVSGPNRPMQWTASSAKSSAPCTSTLKAIQGDHQLDREPELVDQLTWAIVDPLMRCSLLIKLAPSISALLLARMAACAWTLNSGGRHLPPARSRTPTQRSTPPTSTAS